MECASIWFYDFIVIIMTHFTVTLFVFSSYQILSNFKIDKTKNKKCPWSMHAALGLFQFDILMMPALLLQKNNRKKIHTKKSNLYNRLWNIGNRLKIRKAHLALYKIFLRILTISEVIFRMVPESLVAKKGGWKVFQKYFILPYSKTL